MPEGHLAAKRKIRLLIVEDEPSVAKVVARTLTTYQPPDEEYQFTAVDSLKNAEKALMEMSFDLIILDLGLPDSDGLDTFRAIRKLSGGKPVIVHSGIDDADLATRSVREGAQDYLIKGQADLRDLPPIITKAIDREKLLSDMKRLRKISEDANRYKDRFLSLILSDITTPLASIQGSLEVILADKHDAPADHHRVLIKKAIESAGQIMEMTRELLDMRRFEEGAFKPVKRFFDLHSVSHNLLTFFEGHARSKKVELIDETEEGHRVYSDPQLVDIVLRNFVSNAVKFTQEGGTVTIFSPKGKKGGTVGVKDTGVGIPESDIGGIFKEDVRTTNLGTAGETGTGLGLPFNQKIVTALGGKIDVRSSTDTGTTFFITLPQVTPRVLVVDDDPMQREVLKGLLDRMDIVSVEAGDAKEAAARLREGEFHLIILDITLPGVSGFDLLKLLREKPKTAGLPIMIVTADTNAETRIRAFDMGADDFITKPLKEEDCIPRIRKLLAGEVVIEDDGDFLGLN